MLVVAWRESATLSSFCTFFTIFLLLSSSPINESVTLGYLKTPIDGVKTERLACKFLPSVKVVQVLGLHFILHHAAPTEQVCHGSGGDTR